MAMHVDIYCICTSSFQLLRFVKVVVRVHWKRLRDSFYYSVILSSGDGDVKNVIWYTTFFSMRHLFGIIFLRLMFQCLVSIFLFLLPGPFAGTVLGMPLSGVIAYNFGWPWVFYVFGVLGVVWSFFWFSIVTDSPKDQPKISKDELRYILESLR